MTIPILCNGRWLLVDRDLWNSLRGPKPYHGFENDGCSFVRDVIRGYIAWPACVIHDWHFSKECEEADGEDAPGFTKSNLIFAANTYTCLRFQGMNCFSAAFYASVRFKGVQLAGEFRFRR